MMLISYLHASTRLPVIAAAFCVLCFCGCSSDPTTSSLFDHDHEVPDHWPQSLGDTAVKMRERLERLDDTTAGAELVDLVSWTPEVAADTSISEKQWNPIYEVSESLRLSLAESNGHWGDEDRLRVEELCVLIDAAWSQLPEEERLASHRHGHSHSHDHDHDHDHGDGHTDHDHDSAHTHDGTGDDDHDDSHSHDHDHGHSHDHGDGHADHDHHSTHSHGDDDQDHSHHDGSERGES